MLQYRTIILLLTFALTVFAQQSIEELASIPTPANSDGTLVGDGNRNVLVQNQNLFVLNYWVGLQVFDISDPRAPKELSVFRTNARNFNFLLHNERYLFIAAEASGVYILDVFDPGRPRIMHRLDTDNWAVDVAISGNTLAVATGDSPIELYDISDLNQPRKRAEIANDTWVWTLSFFNGDLFAGSKDCCLFQYDISQSDTVRLVQRLELNHAIRKIIGEEDFLYVGTGSGGIYTFARNSNGMLVQRGVINAGGYVYDIFKSGDFIFTANEKLRKLQIIDVSNVADPSIVYDRAFSEKVYGVIRDKGLVFIAADRETYAMRYNNAPQFNPIADKQVNENEVLRFTVSAYDQDYDPFVITVDNLPEGATFDSLNYVFNWTPSYEQAGVYANIVFTVQEQSESMLLNRDTVAVFVNHVNRSPQLVAIRDTVIAERDSLVLQLPMGTDPDNEDAGKLRHVLADMPAGANYDSLKSILIWRPDFEQSGLYSLTLNVQDPSGLQVAQKFTISVNHVDRPPVVDALAESFSVNENEILSVTVTGSDPDREDQNNFVWRAQNLPPGAQFSAATQELTWKPDYEQSGVYPGVTVFLQTNAYEDSVVFAIHAKHVNRSPVLDAVGDQEIAENDTLSFILSGSDPDREDSLQTSFAISGLPEGATFTAASGLFSWQPNYEQSGEYKLTLSMSDTSGAVASEDIAVRVVHVNRPPQLDSLQLLEIAENQDVVFVISASDPDVEDQGKLLVRAEPLPEGASLNENSGELRWLPTYEQSGTYDLAVTVTDPVGREDSQNWQLVVSHVNRPPLLDPVPTLTIAEGQELVFPVSGSDADVEDASRLRFTLAPLPEGAQFDTTSNTFTWTPTFVQSGAYAMTLRLSDGAGGEVEAPVQISVTHVNRTPVWDVELPAQTADEGSTLTFTLAAASDPDTEDAERLTYTLIDPPQGASLNAESRLFSWNVEYDQAGEYVLQFSVSDDEFTLEREVQVTIINVNKPPQIEAIDLERGAEGQEYRFVVPISDPDIEDKDNLRISTQGLPTGAEFDAATATFAWTPGFDQAGDYSFSIIVSDPAGAEVSKEIAINIANVNRSPQLTVGPVPTLREGQNMLVRASGEDADGDDLTFRLRGEPAGMRISSDGEIEWESVRAGAYQVTIVVSDGNGGEDESNISVTVAAPPPAPADTTQ
jgi:hypothetical protein